jgi:hypothetical protein
LNNVIWTEVEYVTAAELDTVREFYRDVFRTEGWSVGDVGFSEGTWNFFVIEGECEVYVELESQDEIVEMDFELTEPKPNKELKPEQKDEPEKRSAKSNTRTSPSPAYDYDDDYGEGYNDLEGGED